MLICPQDEMSTRADCDKAFKLMGLSVATQTYEGLYVLKVAVTEIEGTSSDRSLSNPVQGIQSDGVFRRYRRTTASKAGQDQS